MLKPSLLNFTALRFRFLVAAFVLVCFLIGAVKAVLT